MNHSARQSILDAIRSCRVPPADLPDVVRGGITYPDPLAQFVSALESVGGTAWIVAGTGAIASRLESLETFRSAQQICSLRDDVVRGNVDLSAVDDPHALADVDFAIVSGRFCVAENGAVWVDDADMKHRVLPFLTQHLAIVAPATEIVHTMHEAYQRLEFTKPGFGTFISGPSKTADIEQSLVIGAHGARSLHVFLVQS